MELTGAAAIFGVVRVAREAYRSAEHFFERALSFHSGTLCPEQTYDRAGATAPVKKGISEKAKL
jgi:hypothetical protein